MKESDHIHDINILQDLYDPESPPEILKPDSILSVRVNPSGELHLFHLLFQIRSNHPFIRIEYYFNQLIISERPCFNNHKLCIFPT